MAIFDTLKSIYDAASTINDLVKAVKANKAQCNRLSERVKVIVLTVRKLEAQLRSSDSLSGLEQLSDHLDEACACILRFTRDDWFTKIFDVYENKDRFLELSSQLNEDVIALGLSIDAQLIINQVENAADQKSDLEDIQAKQDVIIKLNRHLIETQQKAIEQQETRDSGIASKQEAHQQALNEQLASIKLKLLELTVSKPRSESPLPKGFDIPYEELHFHERLHHDNSGTFYRGTWGVQSVWIKTIDSAEENAHQSLRRETTIMSRVRGENVLQLYGACLTSNRTCVVMEFPSNGFLSKILRTQPELVTASAKHQIMVDVAKGLSTLHQQGVIHNALTSEQVVLTETGKAKLIGFRFSHINTASIANAALPELSAHYLAPEIKNHITTGNHASDVYLYGILCLELILGKTITALNLERETSVYDFVSKHSSISDFYKKLIQGCVNEDSHLRTSLTQVLSQLEAHEPSVELTIEVSSVPVIEPPRSSADIEKIYQKAKTQDKAKQYQQAYEGYKQAAEAGHAKAQGYLGLLYLFGNDYLAIDKKKAYYWLLKSAVQGQSRPDIEYNLGRLLEKGDGIKKDLPRAMYWYRRAASHQPTIPEFRRATQDAKTKCKSLAHIPTMKPAEIITPSPTPNPTNLTATP